MKLQYDICAFNIFPAVEWNKFHFYIIFYMKLTDIAMWSVTGLHPFINSYCTNLSFERYEVIFPERKPHRGVYTQPHEDMTHDLFTKPSPRLPPIIRWVWIYTIKSKREFVLYEPCCGSLSVYGTPSRLWRYKGVGGRVHSSKLTDCCDCEVETTSFLLFFLESK